MEYHGVYNLTKEEKKKIKLVSTWQSKEYFGEHMCYTSWGLQTYLEDHEGTDLGPKQGMTAPEN